MTGRKVTAKDAAVLSAVLAADAKATPAVDAGKAAELSVLDGVGTSEAKPGRQRKAPAAKAKTAKATPVKAASNGESKLLRPATKTVTSYVEWLKTELGAVAWADLANKPTRLAEVSLQNYGAYQAARKAQA